MKRVSRWKLVMMLLVMIMACSSGVLAQESRHVMLPPGALTWADVPSLPAGARVAVLEGDLSQPAPFTFRLKFPADFKIPAHWHPVLEHVTVLAGTFNIGMGERLDPQHAQAMPVGGFVVIPPKTAHFAWTTEETIIQVHGVGPWGLNYVNPADDPRKK